MCVCVIQMYIILQNYYTSANLCALFYTHLAIETVFITLSRIDNKYFNKLHVCGNKYYNPRSEYTRHDINTAALPEV